MDFTLPDDIKDIAKGVVAFIDSEVVPLEEANHDLLEDQRKRYDERGFFVPEVQELRKQVRMKSAEAGFYGMFGPESIGGGGLGLLTAVAVWEATYKKFGPGRTLIKDVVVPSPFTNGLTPLLEAVRPEVLEPVLTHIQSGEQTLCFGLSEPGAGSDVYAMTTKAVKDGDSWVINGTKQWITNSMYADHAVVFAITDPERAAARDGGISAFFVPTSTPGYSVTAIPIMGHVGSEIGTVTFDDVRVPESHLMGTLHEGFKLAMGGVSRGRLTMSAGCVGNAEWALAKALEYSQQRKTFGKPLAEHGAIATHLAEMAMDIYAAKAMLMHTAWLVESTGRTPIKELSMLKATATEMLFRVMDRAMQVHGAMGLTNELRLEEGLRFARTMRIPDGTGEIQRRTVVQRMLRGDDEIMRLG